MSKRVFVNQTELGRLFGKSRVFIGKVLKEIGLREPNGKPTIEATMLDLVEEIEGPKPWITVYVWHKERVIPYLEQAGLKRVEDASV